MRIAIDCRYIRERPSGIGAYVRALVDRLPADWEFVLWAHTRAARPLTAAPHVRERTVRGGPTSPASLWWPSLHGSFAGVDLFHVPHNVLPRGVPCPTVVSVHDVLALDAPRVHRRGLERVRGLYYPQAALRALRSATRILASTAATADRVLAWAPEARSRLRVVPLAAEPLFRRPADRDAARAQAAALVGSDAPYLLVVGENSAHKRHDVALAAFAAAAPAPWRLVFVQRLGSPVPLQRAAARAGVADRTVWLTGLSELEVATLMQAATLLIQPSDYEGFGLPVLEAMACGCAVLASDIAPLREITAGAAAIVPAGDTRGFADAIARLLQSPSERAAIVERALARAADFSWDETARLTWSVYKEVLEVPAAVL